MQRVPPDPLQLLAVSLGLPEETRWRGQTIQSGIFKSPIEGRVRIGDLFRIGTAIFEVSQPRQPCMKLGVRFDDPKFPKRFLSSDPSPQRPTMPS